MLLGFIAMEPPNSFESSALRDEANKVLDAIEPLSLEDVLRLAARCMEIAILLGVIRRCSRCVSAQN